MLLSCHLQYAFYTIFSKRMTSMITSFLFMCRLFNLSIVPPPQGFLNLELFNQCTFILPVVNILLLLHCIYRSCSLKCATRPTRCKTICTKCCQRFARTKNCYHVIPARWLIWKIEHLAKDSEDLG